MLITLRPERPALRKEAVVFTSIKALTTGFLCLPLVFFHTSVASGKWALAFNSTTCGSQSNSAFPKTLTKRALLVGINNYERAMTNNPESSRVRRASGSPSQRAYFADLHGPKNDVRAMKDVLIAKYGFEEKNVTVLENEKATRDGILRALIDFLDSAGAGDVCVFYYAGHGSRVKNTKGGEPDNYDESLVPYDSIEGAKDIRDKELARIYIPAIKKGIRLTAIFDSCHSGSIGRGGARPQLVRELTPIDEDVSEAPGFDAGEAPERIGALILSAARDEEQAGESAPDEILAHNRGHLTWALTEILKQPYISPNEPADRIFERVSARMQARGFGHQPVLAGIEKRVKEPLFGGVADDVGDGMTAAVSKLTGRIVQLQGGIAMGLSEGCELKELDAPKHQTPVRLTVTNVRGLSSCTARVTSGDAKSIRVGQLFVLDKWVSIHKAMLTLWIPPAVSQTELSRLAQQIQALRESGRVQIVDDPTTQAAQYVMRYESAGWTLLMPQGRVEPLGLQPAAARVLALLPEKEKPSLFINLPPPPELREKIKLKALIEVTDKIHNAQYALAGRVAGNSVAYAWVRPDVTEEEAKTRNDKLPLRSDWQVVSNQETLADAASALGNHATALCRISGWLQLEAPSNAASFPYRLSLEKIGIGTIGKNAKGEDEVHCRDDELMSREGAGILKSNGSVIRGECYHLALVADKEALNKAVRTNRGVTRQFVYIFSIDSTGETGLLYPGAKGNVENYVPIDSQPSPEKTATPPARIMKPPERIVLDTAISFQAPFGLDTYILLASDEVIPDPFVFNSQGVRTAGEETRRGAGQHSLLEDLINDVNTGTRGGPRKIPQNFSIDRMFLRSVDNR